MIGVTLPYDEGRNQLRVGIQRDERPNIPVTASGGGAVAFIIVSGDKDTMRRILFLRQLVATPAYVFILYGLNGASPQGKAGCVLAALDKINELIKLSEPPALWKIAKDNKTANRCDHEKILRKMYANRRE